MSRPRYIWQLSVCAFRVEYADGRVLTHVWTNGMPKYAMRWRDRYGTDEHHRLGAWPVTRWGAVQLVRDKEEG